MYQFLSWSRRPVQHQTVRSHYIETQASRPGQQVAQSLSGRVTGALRSKLLPPAIAKLSVGWSATLGTTAV